MKPISADSHVVEGRDVFTGRADRFGDEAPRIMDVDDQVDAIVIPARGMRGAKISSGSASSIANVAATVADSTASGRPWTSGASTVGSGCVSKW